VSRISRFLLPVLLCTLGLLYLPPASVRASGRLSPVAARQMIRQYFSDLNAHRFHAAWTREAPCGKTIPISNGPLTPPGSEGFQGRGRWSPPPSALARHPILASAHVTGVKRLHIPVFERNGVLAFAVSGTYTFDYSAVPWANYKHTNGFHVIKIAAWRCSGRWGLEPGGWLSGSGGELTWK
jgi:hypothetical protein